MPETQSPTQGGPDVAQDSALLPADHWLQATETLSNVGDGDSSLGEDSASSTASLSSSILQYRTINGRTYHSERGNAHYWASNDEKQNEALDIIHHIHLLSLDNKLHLAPLKKDIQNALDIGTGTGIWAIDFADEYPSATVIGTDISPIQPSWVPPNLKFEIEDCTQEWSFPDDTFDYVHLRYLVGSVADWDALFAEAYRVCRPGGWVESFEAAPTIQSDDGTVAPTTAMSQWGHFFVEGGRKMGRPFTLLEDDVQRKGLASAGFVDVQYRDLKCPIGGWPQDPKLKEIGRFSQLAFEQDIEGYVLYMAGVAQGWTPEQVKVYCAHLRRELRSGQLHGYYRQRVVWARKPDA